MIVALIAALDEAGGIGKQGALPWRLSDDLRQFKALTMGHHLILGRKTWASLGQLLPGRKLIILTRQPGFAAPGCQVAHSLPQALDLARQDQESEVFIGGGGEIFAQALPLAQRLYLTRVHTQSGCDVFFPPLDWAEWQETARQDHPADARNDFAFTYTAYSRQPTVYSQPILHNPSRPSRLKNRNFLQLNLPASSSRLLQRAFQQIANLEFSRPLMQVSQVEFTGAGFQHA